MKSIRTRRDGGKRGYGGGIPSCSFKVGQWGCRCLFTTIS